MSKRKSRNVNFFFVSMAIVLALSLANYTPVKAADNSQTTVTQNATKQQKKLTKAEMKARRDALKKINADYRQEIKAAKSTLNVVPKSAETKTDRSIARRAYKATIAAARTKMEQSKQELRIRN